ncbi:MAG: iron-sulfur cluster assembly scaffold protein, partial [Candidatus Roizmanbacteria bacterium]
GDDVTMSVKMKGSIIDEVKHQTAGCALCTASASMVTDYVKGKTGGEIKILDAKWLQELLHIKVSPTRLKCILLPLEAIQKLV